MPDYLQYNPANQEDEEIDNQNQQARDKARACFRRIENTFPQVVSLRGLFHW